MGKGLQKLFKNVVKGIPQDFPPLGDSGSEVSYFITEPRNFAEAKKLSDNIKKPWLKANLKQIKNLINNQTFLVENSNKGDPVTSFMDVYKSNIQSNGTVDKINMRTVVIRDLQDKELVGNNWSPTASIRPLKYNFSDSTKHKA